MFDHYQLQQTTPTEPPPSKKLRFDKKYIVTVPGILKVVELICNLVGFICIKVSWAWLSAIFYNILYWCGIMITGTLLILYLFHFVEKYEGIPWLRFEFFFCAVMALTYIGTSIFAATVGENGYAVGFFGLCAIIAYGFDAFLKYKLWKRGLPPQ